MTHHAADSPQIRPMAQGHVTAVAALMPSLGYEVAASNLEERWQALARQSDHVILVALVMERVIGVCHAQSIPLIASNGYVEVHALVVAPAGQRCGAATALVQEVERWTRQVGMDRVRLRSGVHREESHAFYRAIGFSQSRASYAFEKAA